MRVAREMVEQVVTVTEEEIVNAVRFLMERNKLVAEGSGAAACAALLHGKANLEGADSAVVIVSGGNLDLERFAQVL